MAPGAKPGGIIPVERIAAQTYLVRGQSVMLDSELAHWVAQHDQLIGILLKHIRTILEPPKLPAKPSIGFRVRNSKS